MKADTVSVFLKGVGFIGGAFLVQFGTSLGQYANTGTWPDKINWVVIWVGAGAQACVAMVTFASGAWSNWRAEVRNGNAVDKPPKPADVVKP